MISKRYVRRLISLIIIFLLEIIEIDDVICVIIGYAIMLIMKKNLFTIKAFTVNKVYSVLRRVLINIIYYYVIQ